MKKHVIKICQTAYFELKRLSLISRFLTEDAAKTLVISYILSRLDYCNCLLMGTHNSVTHPLQKIHNFAARLVLLASRRHHSTPLLEKNALVSLLERIKYKVACMCLSVINGSSPAYLSELLHVYIQSRTPYALLLTPACRKFSNTNARLVAFHFLLLWTRHLEFSPTEP